MKWKTAQLDSIADVIRGVSFSANESNGVESANTIGVLRAGNIQEDLIVDTDLIYIPKKKVNHQQLIKVNDITMCTSSGSPKVVGKTAYALRDTNRTVGAFCCIIRAKQDLTLPRYLFHFLNSAQFRKWTELSSGINIKNIKISELQGFIIPLPPLAEQRRIAAILDKADAIRRKRQQSLELADSLLKSVFLDMFGDPVTNPKGWEKGLVGAVLETIEAGWSANGVARLKQHGELAVLKVSAVTYGAFNEDEYKVIENGTSIKKHIYPQKGDLLFSRANTRELVGATCLIFNDYPELLLPDKLWKLHFNEKTNNYYMKFALSSADARGQMTGESTGTSGSMYNISMEKLKNISVCLPPVALQNKFATVVEAMEASRCIIRQTNKEADQAFKSLQQSFFG